MNLLLETFATIPSPGSGELKLGPLTFRAYGLMIAAGVVAAVWLCGRRMKRFGIHPDHAAMLAMWVVPFGLVGARAYHVFTDWERFEGRWGDVWKVWEGGLGILGGVIVGATSGIIFARRSGIAARDILDFTAPAVPLAQAIGRWGNYFNQELFGRPTDVAWAVEIDEQHRPTNLADQETFHPTFLYESLWNLGVVVLVLWVDSKHVLKRGYLFFMYLAAYAIGRLWIEDLRIDRATQVGGLRINIWIFGALLAVSVLMLIIGTRRDDETGQAAAPLVSTGNNDEEADEAQDSGSGDEEE